MTANRHFHPQHSAFITASSLMCVWCNPGPREERHRWEVGEKGNENLSRWGGRDGFQNSGGEREMRSSRWREKMGRSEGWEEQRGRQRTKRERERERERERLGRKWKGGWGDWRAAGEMNGGQAGKGPPLSGQCACVCVPLCECFDHVCEYEALCSDTQRQWVETWELGSKNRIFKKRARERGEQRQRERWIGPNVSRIRDLGLVGTASVFFSFFLLTWGQKYASWCGYSVNPSWI